MFNSFVFSCPKCNRKVQSTKQIQISHWPKILILHLKRFQTDPQGNTSRIGTLVNVPLTLELKQFVDSHSSFKTCKYELFGVVNHISASWHKGHYTANCRPNDGMDWFKFDDENVTSIKTSQVIDNNAYILMFRLKSASPRNLEALPLQSHRDGLCHSLSPADEHEQTLRLWVAMTLTNSIVKRGDDFASSLVPIIAPLCLTATGHTDAKVRTTAWFCIGLCAISNPNFMNLLAENIGTAISNAVSHGDTQQDDPAECIVLHSAVAASFRLLKVDRFRNREFYNKLLELLPITSDADDAAAVVEIVVEFQDSWKPPSALQNLAILQTEFLVQAFKDDPIVRAFSTAT